MKFVSWNVNGLRACVGKNFMEEFEKLDADIFCYQGITNIGIMRKRRDIAELRSLPGKNRLVCRMD